MSQKKDDLPEKNKSSIGEVWIEIWRTFMENYPKPTSGQIALFLLICVGLYILLLQIPSP